jgi:Kef-type K+ transport system membrane component KefB
VPGATNFWRTRNGMLVLAAICAVALFIALVVVPAISQSTSIASENVSMTLGAVFFVIAVGCYLAAYFLNKKKSVE